MSARPDIVGELGAMNAAALIHATSRYTEHAADHPEVLAAQVQQLRRSSGMVDVDAHNALLADMLQSIHTMLTEGP